jgi:hypothetical protein
VHGAGDVEEERQPVVHAEPSVVAGIVDPRSVDVLDRHEEATPVQLPGIEEPGDVRVIEGREGLSLATKGFARGSVGEQPKRDGPVVETIGAFGEVNVAGRRPAEPREEPVGADVLTARQRRPLR